MKNRNQNGIFDWRHLNTLHSALGEELTTSVKRLQQGNDSCELLQLNENAGRGSVELATFGEHCSLIIFNCEWLKPVLVDVDDGDRVRFNFSLELDIVMEFDDTDEHDLSQPSWRFINNSRQHLIHESIAENSKTTWVTVAFTPDYLREIGGDKLLQSCTPDVSALFEKQKQQSHYKEFPLDSRLNQITSHVISSNLHDTLHLQYLKAKSAELVCVALDTMVSEPTERKQSVLLRERDRTAIRMAAEILQNNLAQPPSIHEICLMIGINRNKLHYGFKEVYGMSVSRYVQDLRLDYAYERLNTSEDSLLQIALDVGFNHQSSFSTAFKRKFGLSPKSLRQ